MGRGLTVNFFVYNIHDVIASELQTFHSYKPLNSQRVCNSELYCTGYTSKQCLTHTG